MKKLIKSIFLSCFFISNISATACAQVNSNQDWYATAFGQSTDLNFSSLIKTDKVGVNNVWVTGQEQPLASEKPNPLYQDFFIESRGGKIANSHDGMTVFYKKLPITATFTLEADVILQQLGPEVDGKTPAAQEAAGLFVRDVIGPARQDPQPAGYEEFPNASNLLMNAFITQNKKNDNLVQITAVEREGVFQAWGNEGIKTKKTGFQKNINYANQQKMHLKIERTAESFILTWQDTEHNQSKSWTKKEYSGFMDQQDTKSIYVGFFASRNAKIRVLNASLRLTESKVDYATLANSLKKAIEAEPTLILASGKNSFTTDYTLQLQSNHNGNVTIQKGNDQKAYAVSAGENIQFPTNLQVGENTFLVKFDTESKSIEQTITVDFQPSSAIADLSNIYVATDGKKTAKGTDSDPVDLETAIHSLIPGGTIYLADGQYEGLDISLENSGINGRLKTLQAQNLHKVIFTNKTFNLDGHYWQLKGLVFDGNVNGTADVQDNTPAFLRISGSHNIIERVIARNNSDTGIAITAKDKNTRSLWPAYNLIINSDSYNNQDRSGINADGFAAKLGVGAGNIFSGCIAHHNADDGWDLFNKIENGPNEPVLIENSIAYENGRPFNKSNVTKGSIGNGFKLGGEGQPVAHTIINSIAYNNNMDGFTDNFNTGNLTFENTIAFDNARYNYIIRSNPYPFLKPSVVFSNSLSIRTTWENQIPDSFGLQVLSKNNKQLTASEYFGSGVLPFSKAIERDNNGQILFNTHHK